MIVPVAKAKSSNVQSAVAEVVNLLSPDVIRIRYDFGPDWSGDPGIYFRTVLSDEASQQRLGQIARRVESLLDERLDFHEMGVFSYFNYRNDTEQKALRDVRWE
jgi:hypothetical protein